MEENILEAKVGDSLFYYPRYQRNTEPVERIIISETKQSWIINNYSKDTRINKKTLQESLKDCGKQQYYTKKGIEYYSNRDIIVERLKYLTGNKTYGWYMDFSNNKLEQIIKIMES